tara:strand:+ start:94 stop:327 length:234 start_codon:yes stop_codon:yes gene_type:complete
MAIKWTDQIKKAPVDIAGKCRRCGQVVSVGQECPIKLPPPPVSPSCPMREQATGRIAQDWNKGKKGSNTGSAFLARD